MDWQVQSIGPTGLRSGWSMASNSQALPAWDRQPVQNNCSDCASGTYRSLRRPDSLCQLCPPGSYSPRGASECTECPAGQTDHDADARTPCSACLAGQHSAGRLGRCVDCPAGRVDHDGDASSPCHHCPVGSSAVVAAQVGPCQVRARPPQRAAIAVVLLCCGSEETVWIPQSCNVGVFDWDSEPATACTACPDCAVGPRTHHTAD